MLSVFSNTVNVCSSNSRTGSAYIDVNSKLIRLLFVLQFDLSKTETGSIVITG